MIKLTERRAPFWREGESARSMTADRLIACAVLLVLPVVRYGARPLLMTLAVMLTAVLTEMLMCLFCIGRFALQIWILSQSVQ